MAEAQVLPSFDKVYERVWKNCLALWSILLVQFLFTVLELGALFICLIVLFGPLIAKFGPLLLEDPAKIDGAQLAGDWVQRFTDPTWIAIFIVLLFLYLTWWFLLSAVVEGGVFRSFWRYQERGEPFSARSFLREGLQYFWPMAWLQFLLSLYGMTIFIVSAVLILILVGLMSLGAFNPFLVAAVAVFLGLPLLLIWTCICLAFAIFSFTAKARLTRGEEPRAAMSKAYQDCRANRWRILKSGALVFVIYIGIGIGLQVVFGIFGLIPLIGVLFHSLHAVLSTLLALLYQTFMPALSVNLVGGKGSDPLNFIPARGFVLSANAYGEADKIVQLFTVQLGRVGAIVKGVRKPKSKLASAIDLFTESGFSLHRKSAAGLFVLSQAKVFNSHSALKQDLSTLTSLHILGELLVQSLPEAESHPEVYSLLKQTLVALEEPKVERELILAAFTLKLLDLLGYPLELQVCAECGSSLQGRRVLLIPHRGGALCDDCAPTGPSRLKVSPAGLEVLKKLRSLPLEKIHILKLKPSVLKELFLTLMEYLERTIEKKLKTVDYYLSLSKV